MGLRSLLPTISLPYSGHAPIALGDRISPHQHLCPRTRCKLCLCTLRYEEMKKRSTKYDFVHFCHTPNSQHLFRSLTRVSSTDMPLWERRTLTVEDLRAWVSARALAGVEIERTQQQMVGGGPSAPDSLGLDREAAVCSLFSPRLCAAPFAPKGCSVRTACLHSGNATVVLCLMSTHMRHESAQHRSTLGDHVTSGVSSDNNCDFF